MRDTAETLLHWDQSTSCDLWQDFPTQSASPHSHSAPLTATRKYSAAPLAHPAFVSHAQLCSQTLSITHTSSSAPLVRGGCQGYCVSVWCRAYCVSVWCRAYCECVVSGASANTKTASCLSKCLCGEALRPSISMHSVTQHALCCNHQVVCI